MSRQTRPDRAAVLATVGAILTESGRRWAWQGPSGAPEAWAGQTGPKDLDLWCCDGEARSVLEDLRAALCAATVALADDPRRLRHTVLAVETTAGLAVVDITVGDLRVGPILLVPSAEVTVDGVAAPRLTGATAAADLLIRPVLRGRIPEPSRLAEARTAWAAAGAQARQHLVGRLAAQLGTWVTGAIVAALEGDHGTVDHRLPGMARRRLLIASVAPRNLPATIAQRSAILPARWAAGPLGQRIRGVVVALIGTDGSGKTTVARDVDARLLACGFETASVYFGMARGNLPGVGLARRILRGEAGGGGGGGGGDSAAQRSVARTMDHPRLRQVAAWYYAVEYVVRYARLVAPQRRRRRVVIVDRWVYDLHDSPWPGSPAAVVIRWIVPAPDIVALPDAPVVMLHARQPERPLTEQTAEQERYRALVAGRPAAFAEVVVDTSGLEDDGVAPLIRAVVEAAHGQRWERGAA